MGSLRTQIEALDSRIRWWHLTVTPEDTVGDRSRAGWNLMSQMVDSGVVASMYARLLAQTNGRADVAGSYLAGALGSVIVEPLVESVVADRCGFGLVPSRTWIRLDANGVVDGLAVDDSTLWVIDGDERSDRDDVAVLADDHRLDEQAASTVADALGPLFDEAHRLATYGLAGMWGGIADEIGTVALRLAEDAGTDAQHAWSRASALIAALAERVPQLRVRPKVETVSWSGGTTAVPLKGTCCLYYKLSGGVPNAHSDGYCPSCPLRSPHQRQLAWRQQLARRHGDGAPDQMRT